MDLFDNPADDIQRAFNAMVNYMVGEFKRIYDRVDNLGGGQLLIYNMVTDLPNKLASLETQLQNYVTSAIQPLEDKITELEKSLPSFPSIPDLGVLSTVDGVKELVSSVNVVSDFNVLMSIFNGLSSFSSAQGTLSQDSIPNLLTTIKGFVDEIKNVINKKVPTPAAEALTALLSVIDHSITSVNSVISSVFADEEVWKLLNYIQVFGEAIDTMTLSISRLTTNLEQALLTNDAETISGIIGLAGLVSKGFSELATLLGTIVPLEVGAGGSGGVAAGIEGTIIGKVNVLSIGPATFGTIGFIFSTLANVLEFVKDFVKDE